ncbi:alginate export family protein [Methylocaldum sp.]|uniref:alginate export family protein n=1 Tax=Methylocaldum sp. TaxID=1969727 RepID=UPI002D4D781F|nr:alginate export family protein [Methylocaldum sp.]HYE38114.1 alginate export family protein [Methylocaldum sp.]
MPLLSLGIAVKLGHANPAVVPKEFKPWGQINENLRITGELRGRYEAWDFFKPSPAANNNNDYDFWAIRARLGVLLTTPHIDGYVQGEYSGLYDLPSDAVAVPGGPLGLGAAYFSENRAKSPSDVHLKQAYLNFKLGALGLPGLSLKVGRLELLEGLEYKVADPKFYALKVTRASQRLMGTFDFTHAARNFDGFSMVYDQPAFNLTVSGAHPNQGGFNIHAQDEISHIDLFYTALTSKKDALLPGTEGRLFYLYYGDDRNTQVVDNRPASQRPRLNRPGQDLNIHNVGTHLLGMRKLGPGEVDGLLWGVYQFGDWTNQSHQAWAVDAEAGYQWIDLPLKPWLRAGYFRSSGDDNSNDGRHETFFQVLPTVRLYAKFPYFNLMNLQDAFAQLIVAPTPATKVAVDFHHLSLSDSSDLFYAGAGATSRSGSFGFLGRNAHGRSDAGELVDVSFTQTLTKELSWNLYYGHAFGGNVTETVYRAKKDADYGFVEFNLAF